MTTDDPELTAAVVSALDGIDGWDEVHTRTPAERARELIQYLAEDGYEIRKKP